MTTKLEPRVSILEKGQETLSQSVANLAEVVKEQNSNLNKSIMDLAKAQNDNYNQLSLQISKNKQTDWPVLLAVAAILISLCSLLSVPVWQGFAHNSEKHKESDSRIERIENYLWMK